MTGINRIINQSDYNRKIWLFAGRIPPEHSGGGQRCVNHAKWFADKGYDVSILSTTKNPSYIEGVNLLVFSSLKKFHYFSQYINLILKYYGFIKFAKLHGPPDVVHSFGGGLNSYIIALLKKRYRYKSIVEITVALPAIREVCQINPNNYFKKHGSMKADILLANSEGVRNSMHNNGINRQIQVIANAVKTEDFTNTLLHTKGEKREYLNLPINATIILMVGAMGLRKGHDIGIKAIHKLLNIKNICLVLVGPYSLKQIKIVEKNLTAQEIETFHSKKVIMVGMVHNVSDYYHASDILLLPSRNEGLPNVVLEAMASKTPVIASNLPGITDMLIKHSENGLIAKSNHVDDYVSLIREIMTQRTKKEQIIENAYHTVLTEFSEDKIYEKYMRIYD